MATVQTISEAFQLIESKKERLKTAFEDLQCQCPSFPFFNFTWSELDSYFTSLQSSLQQKFDLLQSLESPPQSRTQLSNPSSSLPPAADDSSTEFAPVSARPELKSFCQRMDGCGLVRYMADRQKEVAQIRAELADAWKHAPDAATMVLDSIVKFYGKQDWGLSTRNICLVMAEELKAARVEIGAEAKERARRLAAKWKRSTNTGRNNGREVLWFLRFLSAFGLGDACSVNEIFEYVACAARTHMRQAVHLCRALVCEDKFPNLIRKLISKGKLVQAVRFSFEFGLTDKFPPVPLLKAHVEDAKKGVKNFERMGKNSPQALRDAASHEVGILRSVMSCIEAYNLESEYPKADLLKRLEIVERKKNDKKRPAAETNVKIQEQSKRQNRSKENQPQTTSLASPATNQKIVPSVSAVPSVHPPNLQTDGLLPDHSALQLDPPAFAFDLPSSIAVSLPYPSSSSDRYGVPRIPHVSINSAESSLYLPFSRMSSFYYDTPNGYGEYGLASQYLAPYYRR